jgi:hypothetical protein
MAEITEVEETEGDMYQKRLEKIRVTVVNFNREVNKRQEDLEKLGLATRQDNFAQKRDRLKQEIAELYNEIASYDEEREILTKHLKIYKDETEVIQKQLHSDSLLALPKGKKHTLDISKLVMTQNGLLPFLEAVYLYYRSVIDATLGLDAHHLDSRRKYFTRYSSGVRPLSHFRTWASTRFPIGASEGERFEKIAEALALCTALHNLRFDLQGDHQDYMKWVLFSPRLKI